MSKVEEHLHIPEGIIIYHSRAGQRKEVVHVMRTQDFGPGMMLLVELQSYENQGISLWLEGKESSPQAVNEIMAVRETGHYMRDYVIDDGIVSEIRFDRITRE